MFDTKTDTESLLENLLGILFLNFILTNFVYLSTYIYIFDLQNF